MRVMRFWASRWNTTPSPAELAMPPALNASVLPEGSVMLSRPEPWLTTKE
jgi:hypothetical protein